MTVLTFSFLLGFISILAGLIGSLTGLGGGVVIIPALVLLFKIDIHFAMGASIISVIATSSGTAAAYLKQGYTNLRIGMFLEAAAVTGALIGAAIIPYAPITLLTIIFSGVLFLSAYLTLRRKDNDESAPKTSHPLATLLKLDGTYPASKTEQKSYHVQNVPTAFGIMGIAGLLSGLLGIGSGTVKVLAMDQALHLPYKVSTTTSNFMIGITAAVSAGVYFTHGYINPAITFPVMIGVLIGAFFGAKILNHVNTRFLRILFSVILCFIAVQMMYKSFAGSL